MAMVVRVKPEYNGKIAVQSSNSYNGIVLSNNLSQETLVQIYNTEDELRDFLYTTYTTVGDSYAPSQIDPSLIHAYHSGEVTHEKGVAYSDNTVGQMIENQFKEIDKLGLSSFNSNQSNALLSAKKSIAEILAGNVAQLKWVSFGDSMAATKTKYILPHLISLLGTSGTIGGGNVNSVTLSGVFSYVSAPLVYPFSLTKITATNYVDYGIVGVTANANTYKLYLINNGCRFKVQLDDVDVSGFENIQTTQDNSIRIVTITTPSTAKRKFRVIALEGELLIALVGLYDTNSTGIIPVNIYEGGNELSTWINNQNAFQNLFTVLTDINPNVLSFEMKEGVDSELNNRVAKLFGQFKASLPSTDKMIFLSTPTGSGNENQKLQNILFTSIAKELEFGVFDCYSRFGSFENLTLLGWQGDGIHLTDQAHRYLSDEFIKEFNLNFIGGTSFFSQIKSDSFSSRGVVELFAEPIFKFDGILKANRFLDVKNKATNSTIMRIDTGGPSSNGLQSFIPQSVKIGQDLAGFLGLSNTKLRLTTNNQNVKGDLELSNIFSEKLNIRTGANASAGFATLVNGTILVETNQVTASSGIKISVQPTGQYNGRIRVSNIISGTSFTISSSDVSDNCKVYWEITN